MHETIDEADPHVVNVLSVKVCNQFELALQKVYQPLFSSLMATVSCSPLHLAGLPIQAVFCTKNTTICQS